MGLGRELSGVASGSSSRRWEEFQYNWWDAVSLLVARQFLPCLILASKGRITYATLNVTGYAFCYLLGGRIGLLHAN